MDQHSHACLPYMTTIIHLDSALLSLWDNKKCCLSLGDSISLFRIFQNLHARGRVVSHPLHYRVMVWVDHRLTTLWTLRLLLTHTPHTHKQTVIGREWRMSIEIIETLPDLPYLLTLNSSQNSGKRYILSTANWGMEMHISQIRGTYIFLFAYLHCIPMWTLHL